MFGVVGLFHPQKFFEDHLSVLEISAGSMM